MSNEPIYPPCPNGYPVPCWCHSCRVETDRLECASRAEAAARAPETATQCAAREREEIIAARRASNDESDRLRTFLKDCCCPCCDARARLRALSYERAYNSAAPIHCASTDRRDYPSDPATLVRGSDEERLAAISYLREIVVACLASLYPRRFVEIINRAAEKEFRSASERHYETDTDAR